MVEKSGGWHAPPMTCAYGIPAEEIAERCGVDLSTARRWKTGASRIPHAAQLVLEADLGAFSKAARGWRIAGEELISPEGWQVRLSEVRALPLMRQQITTYQSELRQYQERENQIEEQPVPDQWDVQIVAGS